MLEEAAIMLQALHRCSVAVVFAYYEKVKVGIYIYIYLYI